MISVQDLRKVYHQGKREVVALDGVNLAVPEGSIHGIIGHSGAGKSTLVRCLTMLDTPTSGTVRINAVDLMQVSSKELRDARRRIGMVFQHANLLSSRTVLDNVALPMENTGVGRPERNERSRELIALVGLEGMEKAYPAQLSGGQRQRVGIARALAADPKVLLCDEPTSALDPATTNDILELIRSIALRLNLTVLVITHEMGVLKSLCDSVSLLDAGRIVETGLLEEVAEHLGSRLSTSLLPLPEEIDDVSESNGSCPTYIETLGSGAVAEDPIASTIHGQFQVPVRIVAGSIEQLNGTRFSHYLLRLDSSTSPPVVSEILQYLKDNGFVARQRNRAQVEADQQIAQEMGGAR